MKEWFLLYTDQDLVNGPPTVLKGNSLRELSSGGTILRVKEAKDGSSVENICYSLVKQHTAGIYQILQHLQVSYRLDCYQVVCQGKKSRKKEKWFVITPKQIWKQWILANRKWFSNKWWRKKSRKINVNK